MDDTEVLDKCCSDVDLTPHLICITHLNDETDAVMDNKSTQNLTAAIFTQFTTYPWPG